MNHKVLQCYDWLKREAHEQSRSQGDFHVKCGPEYCDVNLSYALYHHYTFWAAFNLVAYTTVLVALFPANSPAHF